MCCITTIQQSEHFNQSVTDNEGKGLMFGEPLKFNYDMSDTWYATSIYVLLIKIMVQISLNNCLEDRLVH